MLLDFEGSQKNQSRKPKPVPWRGGGLKLHLGHRGRLPEKASDRRTTPSPRDEALGAMSSQRDLCTRGMAVTGCIVDWIA